MNPSGPIPDSLSCAFRYTRSIAIVLGLMAVSVIAGWLIGHGEGCRGNSER